MLWRDPIVIDLEGLSLKLPHPVDYCLHKLIIQAKRKKAEKKEKDLETALSVLEFLLQEGKEGLIVSVFQTLFPKEKKLVVDVLRENNRKEIRDTLLCHGRRP